MVDKTLITGIIVIILLVILYIEMVEKAKAKAKPKVKAKPPKPVPKVKEQKWGTSWTTPYYFRGSHEMGVIGTLI
jgi:hypothetical protein